MSTQEINTTIYQCSPWRIRANLLEQTRDFVAVEQIFFGGDYDWKALKAERLTIRSVEIEVKPAYNFTNMAAYGQGVITCDFPVYVNFYMTNTASEDFQIRNWGDYLTGKTAMGYATTGVKSTYDGTWYKTTYDLNSLKDGKYQIIGKDNGTASIDDWQLKGENIALQKGRVVVYIKLADFKLPKGHCITAGNALLPGETVEPKPDDGQGGEDGDGQGVIRFDLMRYLRKKSGMPEEPENVVIKGKKESGRKAKRNPPPPVDPDTPSADTPETGFREGWVEDVIVTADKKEVLTLDYTFWVKAIFRIVYQRGSN